MGLSRDFLAMLQARVAWEKYTGDDQWGNNVYDPPVVIEAFVGTMNRTYGAEDGQGQQDAEEVLSVDLITDYKGIGTKDRITINSRPMNVATADVVHDQQGEPLFQNVTVDTRQRG